MARASTRPSDATAEERKLFERPDGQPYEFWIQWDLNKMLQQELTQSIVENGGRINEARQYPKHGFFLIDPTNIDPLYEIKTTYHKPIAAYIPYQRTRTAKPSPLRHVLAYHFVNAVVQQGYWDRHDLLKWGFPVELSPDDSNDPEAAAQKYRRQIRQGVDPELENGWVWAVGNVFDLSDPNYDYAKEFEKMDEEISRGDTPKDDAFKNWAKGRVVANYKLGLQTKFYLHDDIEEDVAKKIVKLIMKNGGVTCYRHDEADVILIGSKVNDIEDDPEIVNWIAERSRANTRKKFSTLIKFVAWVDACIEVGDWRRVDEEEEDVVIAYQSFKGTLRRAKAKGKETMRTPNERSTEKKRKRLSNQEAHEESSPVKKRKIEADDGNSTILNPQGKASISHSRLSTVTKLSRSVMEPGSGSTVRPTRIFKGVVPPLEPSPLKHGQSTSAAALTNARKPPVEDLDEESSEELNPEEAIFISPKGSPIFEQDPLKVATHFGPRLSKASVLTADTAISSRVGNTTATTAATTSTKTSNATESARSVGPNIPSNAKQVGRPSTSTGVETSASGASRGVLDNSASLGKHNSLALTTSARASNLDDDDIAGDRLLGSFEQHSFNYDDTSRPSSPYKLAGAPFISTVQITAAEEKLLTCWREMIGLNYRDGLDLVEDLVKAWPESRKELEAKQDKMGTTSGKGKGRARVSFQGYEDESSRAIILREDKTDALPQDKPEPTKVDEERPNNSGRFARKGRGVSKTPDSVEPSDADDEEAAQETGAEELEELPPAKSTSRQGVLATTSNARTPKASTTDAKASRGGPSSDVFGPVMSTKKPAANSKPTKATRSKGETKPSNEGQDGGEEDEDEDDVAPLPSKPQRKRAQKARAGSVVSGSEAEGEAFKPRRGRSASAAPPDVPEKPTKAKPATKSNRRGYATKTTGGHPPRRK